MFGGCNYNANGYTLPMAVKQISWSKVVWVGRNNNDLLIVHTNNRFVVELDLWSGLGLFSGMFALKLVWEPSYWIYELAYVILLSFIYVKSVEIIFSCL